MRILFLGKYCPGPYKSILKWLGQNPEHEAVFVYEYMRRETNLNNVQGVQVKIPNTRYQKDNFLNRSINNLTISAESFAKSMQKLKDNGFYPDFIYLSATLAVSVHAKNIFPDSAQITNFEFYFNADDNILSKSHSSGQNMHAPMHLRNLFQLEAFDACTHAITESKWQKQSYPKKLQKKMKVIPQGVDTAYFAPAASRPHLEIFSQHCEIVTYISRTISSYGGFDTFYRSLPKILAERKNCNVLIIGYPEKTKHGEQNLLEKMVTEVKLDNSRVHFIKFCSYENYRSILRASNAHVFLSVPMSLPQGLLEAMSCGCLVIASDTAPVKEVITHKINGLLTDFNDPKALADNIIYALEQGDALDNLRINARKKIVSAFNAEKQIKKYLKLIQTQS